MKMVLDSLKNEKFEKKGRLRTQKRKNKKTFSIRSDSTPQAGQPKTFTSVISPASVDEIEEKKRQARSLRFGTPPKSTTANTTPSLAQGINGNKVNSSSSLNRLDPFS